MKVKYENDEIVDLDDFRSYSEFADSKYVEVEVVDFVKEDINIINEANDILFNLFKEDPKSYWEIDPYSWIDDEYMMFLDWCEVFGNHYATYFNTDKAYGQYSEWSAFVEMEAEMWQDDFKSRISGDCIEDLEQMYNFDYDKFERNLDMDFVMGSYGTVFHRG